MWLIQVSWRRYNLVYCGLPAERRSGSMAVEREDAEALRDAVARALLIADERRDHLVGALLAQCLDELDRPLAWDG